MLSEDEQQFEERTTNANILKYYNTQENNTLRPLPPLPLTPPPKPIHIVRGRVPQNRVPRNANNAQFQGEVPIEGGERKKGMYLIRSPITSAPIVPTLKYRIRGWLHTAREVIIIDCSDDNGDNNDDIVKIYI
jgi:hypothetical protein